MLTVARKERLLEAFRCAGGRGLTATEIASAAGGEWGRLRFKELQEEGYRFVEIPSKRRPGTIFRWVLAFEPPVAGDEVGQESLFTPAPDNAIGGE